MSTNEQVGWIVELAVKDGKLDALRELADEMVTTTQENEPGTLTYDWHISENGKEVTIIERYADSGAAMIHINTFAEKFSERFSDVADQTRLLAYGNPNDTVRSALSGAGGIFTTPIIGFSR